MGLANMAHKQIIKGLIFLAIEIAYIAYMVSAGAYYISMLPSLGWRKQEEVFNEQKQIYEYVAGDQSVLLLLYGVITIAITVLFIYMWCENLKADIRQNAFQKLEKKSILLAKMSRIYLIKTYIRHLCFSHLWEYLFLQFYHCCS